VAGVGIDGRGVVYATGGRSPRALGVASGSGYVVAGCMTYASVSEESL
jgi:hypothetical protein